MLTLAPLASPSFFYAVDYTVEVRSSVSLKSRRLFVYLVRRESQSASQCGPRVRSFMGRAGAAFILKVKNTVCFLWLGMYSVQRPPGLRAEECSQAVLARRGTSYVQEGGSLSLLCVVQHCGDAWTGDWMKKNSTDAKFSTVKNSDDGPHLTSVPLSENETHLVLSFPRVNRLDEGSYGCRVTWGQGITDMGHLMYVNVTAGSSKVLKHRVIVIVGAHAGGSLKSLFHVHKFHQT
ncbi:hypothetical protein F2P81_017501 [Scophthalmus maximus]|uniref:Ig-like domain-containing protein n=1 Tax=Scophthalmus maximus TaxID=52904 RepID=A0A6A4SFW9_SCOMX|nr:hypothetical protein F2P81_017501 [Scophthalmus maximus]